MPTSFSWDETCRESSYLINQENWHPHHQQGGGDDDVDDSDNASPFLLSVTKKIVAAFFFPAVWIVSILVLITWLVVSMGSHPTGFQIGSLSLFGQKEHHTNMDCTRTMDGSSEACGPGVERCGPPFVHSPRFHLMDQQGCAENDPNGPFFDPYHGVFHHFFQDHLAIPPGRGPIYGHFVSRDFVHWAQLPAAIWNGIDSSVWPPASTPYDTVAIYTGSAVIVDGAGPGGRGLGVIQIYPGLCNPDDWPTCGSTGTVLAQAVPADYTDDPLLTNWTKPSFNPIVGNSTRDPMTPWKTPSGEWRMRTYDSTVYGAASDNDLVTGKWYEIGVMTDVMTCECPSVYPLPRASPGFEEAYKTACQLGELPDTVQKFSCWDAGDLWQLGTYKAGKLKELGSFRATPGWQDVHQPRSIDKGKFYASKDAEYPTLHGGTTRRVNWGWARVPPASTQTLPREITFNAAARLLQQYPIEEIQKLRILQEERNYFDISISSQEFLISLPKKSLASFPAQSEIVATFSLPTHEATFGISIDSLACHISYRPPSFMAQDDLEYYEVPVFCGATNDTVRLLRDEESVELRLFSDWTFVEAYFARGRTVITEVPPEAFKSGSTVKITSSSPIDATVEAYAMSSIWVGPDEVKNSPRVYPSPHDNVLHKTQ